MDTVELYRQEAARLIKLVQESMNTKTKSELLRIAAHFLRLAEFRSRNLKASAQDQWPPGTSQTE